MRAWNHQSLGPGAPKERALSHDAGAVPVPTFSIVAAVGPFVRAPGS